jgi:septal ring factor EnvC (AmiA/AmiB activator)
MATDTDTTTDDTTTQDDPPTEMAAEKAGADKATETLKAEAERLRKALSEANRKALADRKRLEDIDKENEARETAKLGEAEQLKRQLKALEAEKRAAEHEAAQLKAAPNSPKWADMSRCKYGMVTTVVARPSDTNVSLS